MFTTFLSLVSWFSVFGVTVCGMVLFLTVPGRAAQSSPSVPNPHQAEFDEAVSSFRAKHYDIALADFKKLMGEEPENPVYKKFASEAALNQGDADFVVQTLQPIEAAQPDDWQTHLLLARAYAQMVKDPHHAEKRDEEIALVTKQHNQDPNSQLGKLRDFLLETVHQGDKTIQFYPAFTPWGPYHVHLIARTFDAAGQPGLRITLESNDFDQPQFAKEHPAEAAAGQRGYSLDGYAPDQKSADGRTIQTHYTYGFFTGQPSYEVVRERILAIAAGTVKPLSSRTGPIN